MCPIWVFSPLFLFLSVVLCQHLYSLFMTPGVSLVYLQCIMTLGDYDLQGVLGGLPRSLLVTIYNQNCLVICLFTCFWAPLISTSLAVIFLFFPPARMSHNYTAPQDHLPSPSQTLLQDCRAPLDTTQLRAGVYINVHLCFFLSWLKCRSLPGT